MNLENNYDSFANSFGDPQEFGSDKIYPIKIYPKSIFEEGMSYLSLLDINKNVYEDIEVLKSSYLRFLIYHYPYEVYDKDEKLREKISQEEFVNTFRFRIISMISYFTKADMKNIRIFAKTNAKGRIKIVWEVNDVEHSESDFEVFRKIVLKQNDVPIAEFDIYDSGLQSALDEAKQVNSSNGLKTAGLERQIILCHIETGISYSEIKEYTWYQFKIGMESIGVLLDYKYYRPLEVSGSIKLKSGKYKHWLQNPSNQGKYSDVMIERDNFMGQFTQNGMEGAIAQK